MLASFRLTLFFLHPSVAGNTQPSRRLFLVCLQNACKAISVNEVNGYMAHKKKTTCNSLVPANRCTCSIQTDPCTHFEKSGSCFLSRFSNSFSSSCSFSLSESPASLFCMKRKRGSFNRRQCHHHNNRPYPNNPFC